MSVFPNSVRSWQTNDSDRSIITSMQDNWEKYSSQNLYFQSQADIDVRFYVGDANIWNDMYGTEMPTNRQNFNFNLIRRFVEMPSGYQRQNRKSTIAVPIEGSDQKTSDQLTKILMWNDQQESVLETTSDAFRSALISGISFLQVWMDYSRDPISGDIKVDNVPYSAVIFDPFFRKQDLSDCSFIWKRSYVTPRQLEVLLPDQTDRLGSIGISSSATDGKFQYMPESIFYSSSQKAITYDEYYHQDFRSATFLFDPIKGKQIEWTGEDEDLRYYLQQYPTLKVIKEDVATVKQAIVVNGHVVYNGGNTLGIDSYGFVPVLGYYTPESTSLELRLQGIVRSLRDPQFLFNRTTLNILDQWESQVNSGWIAEAESVVNPKALFKTGQGQVIWTKKGLAPDALRKIEPATINQGQAEMATSLSGLMGQVSGVNEEMLGSATDDKAGVLSMLRQGSGLLTLRILFDQLDAAQKLCGRIRIKAIQKNFTPGKVERILNEEPSPEFYDRDFGTYDAAVEEGFNTTTQKQMAFAQLLHLKEIGVNIPESALIQSASIQNKDELIQVMMQQAEAAEKAQLQSSQMQQQETQATINMAQAQANYQNAGAQERQTRIPIHMAEAQEKRAESIKDIEQAHLNKAKTLREIQDIDISQLERLLVLAKKLEEDDFDSQGVESVTQ